VTTKPPSNSLLMTTTMPAQNTLIYVIISSSKSLPMVPSCSSTAPQMIWQQIFSQKSYPSGRSQHTPAHSGYVTFEGEWWILPHQSLCITHLMHYCSPGLYLEMALYPIFGPPRGLRAHLLYNLFIPCLSMIIVLYN
jgi:hypothetical protein